MPAMTMEYDVQVAGSGADYKRGDSVIFKTNKRSRHSKYSTEIATTSPKYTTYVFLVNGRRIDEG